MAIASITQLREWFRRGAFPTAAQFGALFDSFFHKDGKVPIVSVESLPERLDGKYSRTGGEALERSQRTLAERLDSHEERNRADLDQVGRGIEALRLAEAAMRDELRRVRESGFHANTRWSSAAVPYNPNAIVELGGAYFRARRATSRPPAGLISSGGGYLRSGDGYILPLPPERSVTDDWELYAPVNTTGDIFVGYLRTPFTPLDGSDAEILPGGGHKVNNHLHLMARGGRLILPASGRYDGAHLFVCGVGTEATRVTVEGGATFGGAARGGGAAPVEVAVRDAIVEFVAVTTPDGTLRWFVMNGQL